MNENKRATAALIKGQPEIVDAKIERTVQEHKAHTADGGAQPSGDHVSVFFFSSRRRHTRLQGDWSSDVCSSDLSAGPASRAVHVLLCRWLAVAHRDTGGESFVVPGRLVASAVVGVSEAFQISERSEERRVGEEGRSRGVPDHLKKKKDERLGV